PAGGLGGAPRREHARPGARPPAPPPRPPPVRLPDADRPAEPPPERPAVRGPDGPRPRPAPRGGADPLSAIRPGVGRPRPRPTDLRAPLPDAARVGDPHGRGEPEGGRGGRGERGPRPLPLPRRGWRPDGPRRRLPLPG